MSISLKKGGKVSLSKAAPGLSNIIVGLGWNARQTPGVKFDLDVSVLVLDEYDTALNENYFVFYGNPESPCGSIRHAGDNRQGSRGESIDTDQEQVEINLSTIPLEARRIVVLVSIDDATKRQQNFGMVSSAYIRIMNKDDSAEVAKYDLTESASSEIALVMGELTRVSSEWEFNAVGESCLDGLAGFLMKHGLDVES